MIHIGLSFTFQLPSKTAISSLGFAPLSPGALERLADSERGRDRERWADDAGCDRCPGDEGRKQGHSRSFQGAEVARDVGKRRVKCCWVQHSRVDQLVQDGLSSSVHATR